MCNGFHRVLLGEAIRIASFMNIHYEQKYLLCLNKRGKLSNWNQNHQTIQISIIFAVGDTTILSGVSLLHLNNRDLHMGSANEWRCYNVTSSLIGCEHTKNNTWNKIYANSHFTYCYWMLLRTHMSNFTFCHFRYWDGRGGCNHFSWHNELF